MAITAVIPTRWARTAVTLDPSERLRSGRCADSGDSAVRSNMHLVIASPTPPIQAEIPGFREEALTALLVTDHIAQRCPLVVRPDRPSGVAHVEDRSNLF